MKTKSSAFNLKERVYSKHIYPYKKMSHHWKTSGDAIILKKTLQGNSKISESYTSFKYFSSRDR